MKRKQFLKQLLAAICSLPILSRFARAESKAIPDIEKLTKDYANSVWALHKYRRRIGLTPGARVEVEFSMTGMPMNGTIQDYNKVTTEHYCVPILLDNGWLQATPMKDVKIME